MRAITTSHSVTSGSIFPILLATVLLTLRVWERERQRSKGHTILSVRLPSTPLQTPANVLAGLARRAIRAPEQRTARLILRVCWVPADSENYGSADDTNVGEIDAEAKE